ncbi:glycosyltransferase [Providencia rettgeri]|uniref:glycosyltransferase n=1 Tax=Providencia rettgeri TaxID=587 RepID=UPI00300F852D
MSLSNNPLVSVILPVYNAENYIYLSVHSILKQKYTNFELIIINDGSTDNTLNIINSFNDERIRIINRENKGLVYSLNEGIAVSNGMYICRMDADDISSPQRISAQIEIFLDNPSVDFIFSDVSLIDDDGNYVCEAWIGKNTEEVIDRIEWLNTIYHPSIMFKKNLINSYGNYNKKDNIYEDKDLWLRFKENNVNFFYLKQNLLHYRLCKTSIHSNYTNYWFSVANACVVNRNRKLAYKYLSKLSMKHKLNIIVKTLIPEFLLLPLIKLKNNRKSKKS